jgi:O-antigen ligase
MLREAVVGRINWLIGLALFSTTVVVTPSDSLDPINVPKLLVLLLFSIAVLALMTSNMRAILKSKNLHITLIALSLPVFMLITLLFTKAPKTQQIFGTYGRNTGFLYYLSLSILFLGVSIVASKPIKKSIIYAVTGTLLINCVYGFIQAIGKDWVGWDGAYSPVFGTLGNPDFASALLGFGAAFAISYLLARESSIKVRCLNFVYLIVSLFVIYKSQAQQGFVVLILVFAIIVFFEIRNYGISKIIQYTYLFTLGLISIFAIFGTLQKGPLSEILYRGSITQRGDYWHAGIKMFWSKPFTGIGLDSYGDWYRFFRSKVAAERFNGSVVSNTAHNVFIDIASTSGMFALFSYLSLILFALISTFKYLKSNPRLDPFFIAVFTAWIGYLAQSVISINNIGLGIWGWVLPGILIAMNRWRSEEESEIKTKKLPRESLDFSGMFMFVGVVIGFVIGFIPFNADANLRHALENGNPDKIYSAAIKWPTDSSRMLYAAKIFESNKLSDKADSIIRKSLKQNPRSFEGWQFLYELPTTTGNEKAEILSKLKSLDPNNKNIK